MKKPDILLIGDTDNWAFSQIIKWVAKNLDDDYNIYYDYMVFNGWDRSIDWAEPRLKLSDVFTKPVFAAKRLKKWYKSFGYKNRKVKFGIKPKYDIVVFLDFYMDRKANFNYRTNNIIRGIFTDVFPPWGLVHDYNLNKKARELSELEFINEYFSDTKALLLGSPFKTNFYKKIFHTVCFANLSYEEDVFKPTQHDNGEKLIIGWTGNPNRPWKGFNEIIKPAVAKAQKKYPNITLKTRFYGPMDTLHEFYKDVDLICIASDGDAGPSLFIEASLSGVPAISTNIGLPSVVIQNGVNGYIVEKKIEAFTDKIIYLYEHKEILNTFKAKIRGNYIEELGNEKMKERWKYMFDHVLKIK